jgi:hypothetical protein
LFTQPFLRRKEWLLLVDGKEKESRMDIIVVLKEWRE